MGNDIFTQGLQQIIFIGGLLAGFNLTITVQVLSSKNKQTLITSAACAHIASAAVFFTATFLAILVIVRVAGMEDIPQVYRNIGNFSDVLIIIGSLLFMFGIFIYAWAHSKLVGAVAGISLTIALLSMLIVRITIP